MTDARRFEDLIAWQKARILTREVYAATRNPKLRRDWSLVDQMRRATTSVMFNIAEGFERQHTPDEFSRYLSIAKGSCAEVRSQLYVSLDMEYMEQTAFAALFALAEETSRVMAGLKASVDRRKGKN